MSVLGRLAPDGPAALNRRRGRLAQLVRASRLHREGREFESLAAYQQNQGLRPAFLKVFFRKNSPWQRSWQQFTNLAAAMPANKLGHHPKSFGHSNRSNHSP